MALTLVEGFDHFPSVTELGEKYNLAGSITIETSTVHSGGQSIKIPNTAYIDIPLPTVNTVYIGLAIQSSAIQLNFIGDNSYQNLSVRVAYECIMLTNYAGNAYYNGPFRPKTGWYYVEVKATISDSTGATDNQVSINGGSVYSYESGVDDYNNSNSTTNHNFLRIYSTQNYSYVDDLYVCDTTGSINNSMLGERVVEQLLPNANGNSSQFVGSDADSTDNYLHVDETTEDGDSTYVEASTTSYKDLYGFSGVTASPITINGVAVDVYVRKDDGGGRTGKQVCRSNSTDYEGSTFTPATAYDYYTELWETDPDTSSAWTESAINAAEFGIKVQS